MTTIKYKLIEDNLPTELKQYRQWVLWRYEKRDSKLTKPPFDCNGEYASSTDAQTWTDYDKVLKTYSTGSFDGIGFVVTPTDKYCGVDLDHCRNNETGEITQTARDIITRLNSYTEITPSLTGIRIWIKAKLPRNNNARTRKTNIEIYDQGRFFTITGNHLDGTPNTVQERQKELNILHAELFPPEPKENKGNGHRALTDLADTELLSKAMSARNGDKFRKLWEGDTSTHDGDDSAADLALCSILAFWTENNESRIDSLFRQSRLYREKWDRQDYRERTIKAAINGNHETYNPKSHSDGYVRESATIRPLISQSSITQWIGLTSGNFNVRQIWSELNVTTTEDKAILRTILNRLCDSQVIAKTSIDGTYRRIDTMLDVIDWQKADINNVLPLQLPFDLHKLCKVYPKSIIPVAGSKNEGKTAFLCQCIMPNTKNFKVDFYNSETGPEQLKARFAPLNIPIPAPFMTYQRYDNFADVIHPEHLSIIDYLDLNSEVYLVGEEIDRIFRKLTTGCAIIGLQKPPPSITYVNGVKKILDRDLAYGAGFTAKRACIYISLSSHRLKIVYCKTPMNPKINPNGMVWSYDFDDNGFFTSIQRSYGDNNEQI